MQQPQFNIEGFEITNNEITVNTEKYSIIIPVTIPLDKFEWWLRVNDKLQWKLTGSETQNITGNMSLEEYWQTDPQLICADLYSYVISNPIVRDGAVFTNSVDSLNLAFGLHNARRSEPVFNSRWEHDQVFIELFN